MKSVKNRRNWHGRIGSNCVVFLANIYPAFNILHNALYLTLEISSVINQETVCKCQWGRKIVCRESPETGRDDSEIIEGIGAL